MVCAKCGKPISLKDKSCPHCGTQFDAPIVDREGDILFQKLTPDARKPRGLSTLTLVLTMSGVMTLFMTLIVLSDGSAQLGFWPNASLIIFGIFSGAGVGYIMSRMQPK